MILYIDHCLVKKKFLWWELDYILINGYKDKNIGGSLAE